MLSLLLQVALVAGGGGQPSLQHAIASARPGDTVRVARGRHPGPVVVDRAIVLLGEAGAVLDGSGRGDVLRVTAAGAVVAGLVLERSGTDLNSDNAAVRVTADDVRIENLTIRESLHGIYVQDAAFVALIGNRIDGHTRLAEPDKGNGIHLHAVRHVRLERNRIRAVRDGLYFSYADSTEAIGNTVTHSRYGIHYMFSRGNRFVANRFTENAAGAALMNSWDLYAAGNVFSDHRSYRAYGLVVQTSERARLVGNRFERNTVGMLLDNATDGVLLENLFAKNALGLDMLASSTGNVIAGNVFVGNAVAARRTAGGAGNRWYRDGRGNFWTNATTLDLDRDGVRDLPHRAGSAFDHLAASRPALLLWRGSPGMAILDVAERALPVFNVPVIVDSYPLARMPATIARGTSATPRRSGAPVAALGAISALLGLVGAAVMGRRPR